MRKAWSHKLLKWRLSFLPNPTNALTRAVRIALLSDGFPSKVNYCQMFIRLTYEMVYGQKFEFAHKPSAIQAAHAFKGTQYDVTGETPQPGDLLYQWGPGHSAEGHVGMLIERGMVAQNGSKTYDGTDARGILPLSEFGTWQLLVRPK